jgi:hypothetical protein
MRACSGRLIKAIFQSPEARFIAVHVDAQLRYRRDSGAAQGQQADEQQGDEAGDDGEARRKAVMARRGREGRAREEH